MYIFFALTELLISSDVPMIDYNRKSIGWAWNGRQSIVFGYNQLSQIFFIRKCSDVIFNTMADESHNEQENELFFIQQHLITSIIDIRYMHIMIKSLILYMNKTTTQVLYSILKTDCTIDNRLLEWNRSSIVKLQPIPNTIDQSSLFLNLFIQH